MISEIEKTAQPTNRYYRWEGICTAYGARAGAQIKCERFASYDDAESERQKALRAHGRDFDTWQLWEYRQRGTGPSPYVEAQLIETVSAVFVEESA